GENHDACRRDDQPRAERAHVGRLPFETEYHFITDVKSLDARKVNVLWWEITKERNESQVRVRRDMGRPLLRTRDYASTRVRFQKKLLSWRPLMISRLIAATVLGLIGTAHASAQSDAPVKPSFGAVEIVKVKDGEFRFRIK